MSNSALSLDLDNQKENTEEINNGVLSYFRAIFV